MHSTVARLAAALALAIATASCGGPAPEPPADAPAPAPAPSAAAPSDGVVAATPEQRAEFARWFAAQPRLDINISLDGAKVLILKFNDFQCPPCAETHTAYMPIIKELQAEHPGAVRYQLVDYPLEPECNKYVAIGPHPAACEAAAAVRLAWAQGRQEQMIDWLFNNQFQLTPALVRQGAKDVGQIPDFDAQYSATLEKIQGDIELGHYLEVKQTPTMFVNGVTLEGRIAPDYLEEAIRYELGRATQQ